MSEIVTNNVPEVETAEAAAPATDAQTAFNIEALDRLDLADPEVVRSVAEQVVTKSREGYERTKDAMEDTVEMFEQSIDKAGQGAAAINRKFIDIAQANLNSSFNLAKELAGAKNVTEIMEYQAEFARRQFEEITAQAEEIRNISTQAAADSTEPFKAHVTRSIQSLKVN